MKLTLYYAPITCALAPYITLTEAGMFLLEPGAKPYHTPTRAQEISDVSGAGDTSIAAFTLALAARATGIEAAEIDRSLERPYDGASHPWPSLPAPVSDLTR